MGHGCSHYMMIMMSSQHYVCPMIEVIFVLRRTWLAMSRKASGSMAKPAPPPLEKYSLLSLPTFGVSSF